MRKILFLLGALILLQAIYCTRTHRSYQEPEFRKLNLRPQQVQKMKSMDSLLKKVLMPKARFEQKRIHLRVRQEEEPSSQSDSNQSDSEEEPDDRPDFQEGWLQLLKATNFNPNEINPIKTDKGYNVVRVVGDDENDANFVQPDTSETSQVRKNSQWDPEDTSKVPMPNAFYFRIKNNMIFYNEAPEDLVVLDSLQIKEIRSRKEGVNPGCFTVINEDWDNWTLCVVQSVEDPKDEEELIEEIQPWIDTIDKGLGNPANDNDEPDDEAIAEAELEDQIESGNNPSDKIAVYKLKPSSNCAFDFDYTLHGDDWGCRCMEGKEQSPINFPASNLFPKSNAEEPDFKYNDVKPEDIKVTTFGETVILELKNQDNDFGTLKDMEGNSFAAKEIRIKTPAEHTINGDQFDMEIQIIHKATDGDFQLKAGLAFLYKLNYDSKTPFLDSLQYNEIPANDFSFKTRPSQSGEKVFSEDFNVWKLMYDGENYNDAPAFSFYKYRGSYTSPPCEQDVEWYVTAEPIPLGFATDKQMKEVVYPVPLDNALAELINDGKGNNRNIQPLNNRGIQYFDKRDSCRVPPVKPQPPQPEHYEKIRKEMERYFYVPGDAPSGAPGAFVVPDHEAINVLQPQLPNVK